MKAIKEDVWRIFQRPFACMEFLWHRDQANCTRTNIYAHIFNWGYRVSNFQPIKLITYYVTEIVRFLSGFSRVQFVTSRQICAEIICSCIDLLYLGVTSIQAYRMRMAIDISVTPVVSSRLAVHTPKTISHGITRFKIAKFREPVLTQDKISSSVSFHQFHSKFNVGFLIVALVAWHFRYHFSGSDETRFDCKARPNNSNMSAQHIQCWAQHVACVWPPCCAVMRHVGCCWVNFDHFQIWAINTQHVATCRNTVAKRSQHVAPNNGAICCVGMLRSFGRCLTPDWNFEIFAFIIKLKTTGLYRKRRSPKSRAKMDGNTKNRSILFI